ncbi:MAG TPA: hypothetical protein VKI64_10460 [Acidimicrobiales bacterium]|nr:hypothetical protein [Acidimicrobiales bacterium]
MAGLWALGALRLPGLRTRALWWFTALVEGSLFVQVGLGVGLTAGQHLKVAKFHIFYGAIAVATVGIIYSYRDRLRHRIYLLYGLGGLFLMGLAIRAVLVGRS